MLENESGNTFLMLGEIKGQLRELVHLSNNNTQKLDGLTEKVLKLDNLPTEVLLIKERLTVLEVADNRRAGATGLFHLVVKSPVVAWIVVGIAAIIAFLKGR